MIHEHRLPGCVSTVLAGYLKALGVHRLLAEGPDPDATSCWTDDGVFCVATSLDHDAMLRFFLEQYAPTPLVTPWNGGGGFYAGDPQAGIAAIEASVSPRFGPYRRAIATCRGVLHELGLSSKPSEDNKPSLLRRSRACLEDSVVAWLDAAYVIADDPQYPALLGTGGNDGRLDFANNFMQRLAEMFLTAESGARRSRAGLAARLEAALFAQAAAQSFESAKVGQFSPGQAGGANMSCGTKGEARVNAWDYVLALEGTLVFAGAAVRRLVPGARGSASFPFHVGVSGVGYGTSADADEASRAELWLPLWGRPVGYAELRLLFGEGRLEASGRPALSGLHAVQALASLGVDRGIERFQRLGILQRNGRNHLASHLGTFRVRQIDDVELLRETNVERFLDDVARYVRGGHAQPSIAAALRATLAAMFDACRPRMRLTDVVTGLGALERAVSRSPAARAQVPPLERLSATWYAAADDGSVEFRLAAAFASWAASPQQRRVRQHLEPVDPTASKWTEATPPWGRADPLANVVAIARHRLLSAPDQKVLLRGAATVNAGALSALLAGDLDRARFTDLAFGLALLDTLPGGSRVERDPRPQRISTVFCVLRAVTSPSFLADDEGRHPAPKVMLAILARLAARDLPGAVDLAQRRLCASACHLVVPPDALHDAPTPADTDFDALAAALVLPLPRVLEEDLVQRVTWRTDHEPDDNAWPAPEPDGGSA